LKLEILLTNRLGKLVTVIFKICINRLA
jgi:hypothetical protein